MLRSTYDLEVPRILFSKAELNEQMETCWVINDAIIRTNHYLDSCGLSNAGIFFS